MFSNWHLNQISKFVSSCTNSDRLVFFIYLSILSLSGSSMDDCFSMSVVLYICRSICHCLSFKYGCLSFVLLWMSVCILFNQSIYSSFCLSVILVWIDVCLSICCSNFDVCLFICRSSMYDWLTAYIFVPTWHKCICCVNSSKPWVHLVQIWICSLFWQCFVKCQSCVWWIESTVS